MHIKTLLARPAVTTGPATPLRDAHALMRRRGIRHLPVVETGRLVGMLTERDIERASASSVPEIARHDWAEGLGGLVVADAMARGPLALPAQTAVAEAARLARDRGRGCLSRARRRPRGGRGHPQRPARGPERPARPSPSDRARPRAGGHGLRPGAARALGEALRIAATTGAALTALHVRAAARPNPGREEQERVAGERVRRHVADEAMAILRKAGRTQDVRCEVAEGPVAREIARRAAELDADLIVIGATARRRVLGALVPTLGDRLTPLAPCPVLTIPRAGARGARG